MVPDDFLAKRIQILQDLAGASKIALLVNPSNQIHRLLGVEQSARIARNLGVALLIVEATTPEEIDAAFASAAGLASALLAGGGSGFATFGSSRPTGMGTGAGRSPVGVDGRGAG